MSKEMTVISSTMMGGMVSLASGGDYYLGAMQGFKIALLNHTIHDGGFTYTTDENGNIDVYTPDVLVIAPMLNVMKNIEGLFTFGSATMAYFEHNNYSKVFNHWRGKNGKLYRGLKGQGPNRYTGPRSDAYEKAIKHQKVGKILGILSIANSSNKCLHSLINSGFSSETIGYGIDLLFDYVGTYGGLKGLGIEIYYQYVIKNLPLIRQNVEQQIIDRADMMQKGYIPVGHPAFHFK